MSLDNDDLYTAADVYEKTMGCKDSNEVGMPPPSIAGFTYLTGPGAAKFAKEALPRGMRCI